MTVIGIREEDKSIHEKRVPLVPEDIKELRKNGYEFIVQPSGHRAIKEKEFKKAGAKVSPDLSKAKIIFGVKEIPKEKFQKNKTYVFFSHVIKGQSYNMPMLKKIIELNTTLIDYERIVDENEKRLIFFGNFAGYAGAIDALHLFGKRLRLEGTDNPFQDIKRALDYDSLKEAKKEIRKIRKKIKKKGIPEELKPVVFGFAGYGNVSKGSQEIIDELEPVEIRPDDLLNENYDKKANVIYKVVFEEKHMVEPKNVEDEFELQDYYDNPEKYDGVFYRYLPYFSMLFNCIYWEEKYPRLVRKKDIKELWEEENKKMKVIADISCDVKGAIEITCEATEPDKPSIIYEPETDDYHIGIDGNGIVVLAVDILPSELPKEASKYFSSVLKEFVPPIADADYTVSFKELKLPAPIKKAVIVHKGKLTPEYQYIKKYL